jgi:hypothetical protein
LVASAVKADVEHVERAVGAEDDWIVNATAIEGAFFSRSCDNKFWILIWRAKWRDSIGCSSRDGRLRCARKGCGLKESSAIEHAEVYICGEQV